MRRATRAIRPPRVGWIVLAAAGMILGGCATTRTLSVSAGNPGAPIEAGGKHWLNSVQRNTVSVCLLTPRFKARPESLLPPVFLVEVRNGGSQTLRFSRDDVAAAVDGRPVHLLTHEGYVGEIDRQQDRWVSARRRWANEGPIFSQAGTFPQERSVNDGGRSEDLRTWNSWVVPEGEAQLDALSRDAQSMLEQCAVAPGQTAGGVVRLVAADLARGRHLRISVRVADETHEFVYDLGG